MMSRIVANDRAGERMDREWIIEAKAGEEGGGRGSREWNIRINVTADEASLQHRYIKT